MTKTLPITKVRNDLPTLVNNVAKKLDEYVITVNGIPQAVLMSATEYDSWRETEEILADPKAMEEIRKAEKDIEAGRYITLEHLKKELKLDG